MSNHLEHLLQTPQTKPEVMQTIAKARTATINRKPLPSGTSRCTANQVETLCMH